jgi:uncharacterized protein YpuA (DUF1002 family)
MRLLFSNVSQFKFKRDMLTLTVMTFVTVIFWIIYSVYAAFSKSTVDPSIQQLLTPLNPTLNQEVLALFNDRYQPPTDFNILIVVGEENDERIVPLSSRSQIIVDSVESVATSAAVSADTD